MATPRPSLAQINDRIQGDIKAKIGSQASFLRRSWIGIMGRVFAGAIHLLYGYIQWASRQFFVATADEESIIKKASLYGINRNAASVASGAVSFKGLPGITIIPGTVVARNDGQRYESVGYTDILPNTGINPTPTAVPVKAILPGSIANTLIGASFILESPIAGVEELVTVTSEIKDGTDLETIQSLVDRYETRIQKTPQGGAKNDYENWAKEVPNVGQVKVYGPGDIFNTTTSFVPPVGEVWVYFAEAQSDAQPTQNRIDQVRDYLTIKKPITAILKVFGIKNKVIPIKIKLKVTPGYTQAQAELDIFNSLKDLVDDVATPLSILYLSQINEAISRPISEFSHELELPAANVQLGIDEIGKIDKLTPGNFIVTLLP